MVKNKTKTPIPTKSLDEIAVYFDTHDLGGDWLLMPKAQFDIDIRKRTHLVAIDEELIERLATIARAQHVPVETLINVWLKEKVLEAS